MRKSTLFNKRLVVVFLLALFFSSSVFAQLPVPFSPRLPGGSVKVKGDILLIGNSIVTAKDLPLPYNGGAINNNNEGIYINVASGGDPSIFSSSSADLAINNSCKNILYAGLYWASVYPLEVANNSSVQFEGTPRIEDWNQIKFKLPTGGFIDLEADDSPDPVGEEDDIIFDGYGYYGPDVTDSFKDSPIICYKNVTGLLQGLTEADGEYTVANLRATRGNRRGGCSAGWTLVVIYESPILPSKFISVFDGYAGVQSTTELDIPVSGFQTLPSPLPVNASIGVSALEGDIGISGDSFQFKASTSGTYTVLSDVINESNNFFNSSITLDGAHVTNRNPASLNTLGLDINNFKIPNPFNSVLPNNATAGDLKLTTNGDGYGVFLTSFSVEIIEPKITLTKIVEDVSGNDISNQLVNLGDELNYVIGFQNTGNDDATNLIIRDILPINIVFNYPEDMGLLPPGVTVQSYNATTREIIFSVDDSVVEENDPVLEIRFKATVVASCSLLNDACSNIITNQAFVTYNGTTNSTFTISDDPSFSTNTGCLLTPSATNFLADINCTFEEEVILCGASTVLTAGNGYDTYSWSTSSSGTPVIGTTQSITVTDVGTYYVHNSAIAPCQDTDQAFEVVTFGANVTSPVIPFADQVVTCPNDGKQLPNFFLCGANDSRLIETGITDTTSMIWEQLDETSCAAVVNQNCANEDATCTWNQVGSGPDYLIDTTGQYRLTLNYTGGCFNQFYFNVFENVLIPTATSTDIICTTPGQITVGGVPSGYEYSIDGINYQSSNLFSITTPDIYTAYIRQVGVMPNPCVFTVPDIQIRQRDFTVSSIITQPYCNGELGHVVLAANDVRPQYFFSIYQGATLVNSVGPIVESSYEFENLNPGTYTVNVSTEDGCIYAGDIEIINPPLLTATSALTKPLTCTDGEITVYPVGGTPPYYYFINSTTVFQSTPVIDVTASGTFNITVVDSNNCSTDTSISVNATDAPVFNVTKTDILCANPSDTGVININVTNANGNTLEYSIDNGITFVSSPVFTGLVAGDYEVVVQYSNAGEVCASTPQTINITSVTAIAGTATLTTPYTCNTNGVITVSGVSGGLAPYSYSIDGIAFQSGLTFTGLIDGTYSVTIRDTNDCTLVTAPITIDPLNPPTDLDFSSTAITCPTNTSDVTMTATGGVGVLEYQIIAPLGAVTAYQTSNVFSSLTPGTYTFQVRDENDCTYNESYNITALPALNIVGQTISDITCFGVADGSARFTVSGTTNFTYTINAGTSNTGISPIDLTALAAGNYTIVITDTDTNCQETETVTIDTPTVALSVTVTESPITCNVDGSVVVNAVGGWGSNNYTLTLPDTSILPVQSSNTFIGLTQQGTYTVTVTDAKGCEVTDTFTLNSPTNPSATIDVASNFCYNTTSGASLQVNAINGQTPYEYNINGGPFTTSNTFANLTPGTYTISVRDAYGCAITLPAETIESELVFNTVLDKDLDCTVSSDASITGTFSGGSAPFIYAVSFNGSAYSSLGTTTSPFTYTTAIDGTYQVQITDARGCTTESSVSTINAVTLPEITSVTQIQSILCHGDSNAAIQIDINNTVGTPAFTINVNNDTTGTNYGTQTSGLTAGTYTITLTDSKFCADTETIIITEPNAISFDLDKIDITCDATLGSSLGAIIVENVSGGTAPFTYFISNNFGDIIPGNPYAATTGEDHTFTIINFGTYTINVVDTNGCSFSQQIVIASPPSDLDIDVVTTVPDCISGGTAQITAISALGSGNYEFGILEFNTAPYTSTYIGPDTPSGSVRTFTNLIPGVLYTFVVHDITTDCYFVKSADSPIAQASLLTSTVVPNNVVCQGENNGSVTFTIDNFDSTTTSVDYTLRQAFTNTILSGPINLPVTFGTPETVTIPAPGTLSIGQYYISFIENGTGAYNGCQSATAIFEITESAIDLDITASVYNNANCNANSGLITAIASNGTAPYLYQLTTSSTPPLDSDPSWSSNNTFNENANSYFAHVMDANGCIRTSSVIVLTNDAEPTISATLNNQCTATEGSFEIDVVLTTTGIAPHSYSVDGGVFQTRTAPFTISNLSSGTHTVEVQDTNGCGNLETIIIETPIGLTPVVTALPTCLDNDGEITVTAVGGTGVYTYSISPSPASITSALNVFSGVPSGTYTLTITDATTLCTSDATVTLSAATPVAFTTSVNDVSCNGDNNGIITVNLPTTNNNPIYTYEIIAPITIAPQTSNVFTGLALGNYTVRVNSGRGCSTTEIVPVGEPALLTVSGVATDFSCAIDNSVNTATLTITEIGGTAPFMYSIDGVNYLNTNTFDIIDTGSAQTINIFTQDANGCTANNTVVINPLSPIMTTAVTVATPIDCNNTGSLAVNVTGGSGNFDYQMLPSGVVQTSNIFNLTAPGDYYFIVNDIDTGCYTETLPFTVAPFNTVEVILTPTTAVTCFGDANGGFEINVSGYTGVYNYEVFNSSGVSINGVVAANTATNPEVVSGIPAGNLTVVVTETESPFCTVTSNVITIDSPITALSVIATETAHVTCDNNKGTITAIANGGWGSYEYELTGAATVGYSSNGTFTDLSAGTYTVNIRDANGCIASDGTTLIIPTPINATVAASTNLLSCFGNTNATITASLTTGGQNTNYSYTLNMLSPIATSSGPQISPSFGDLGFGTYTVTITDGYNCEFTSANVVIAEPIAVQANLVKDTSQTCVIDASLTLSATGGTGIYEYSDSSTFSTVLGTFGSTTTITVTNGTYMYYVRDANGCLSAVSNEITIEPLPLLIANLEAINVVINCAGDNSGAITVTAQGGLGSYVYTLQDISDVDITPVTQNSPGVFTNLSAGNYQVQIDSGDCLTTSAQITITEPTNPLSAIPSVSNITCPGINNGVLEITATGGTGIIKYAISPRLDQFFETSTFNNLAPGTYQAVAQDELGCFEIIDFTVNDAIPIILSIVPNSIIPEVCEGDMDGEFSISVSGGDMPYSVAIDDANGTYTLGTLTQTDFEFLGLAGGDHLVYVRDNLGCETEWNITFPESVFIDPQVIVDYGCTNNLSTNTVTVTVDDSITDLSDLDYSLNGSAYQTSNVFIDVPSGINHIIDVRHTNGCIKQTLEFEVTAYQPLELALSDGNLNEIVATATGGSGIYDYDVEYEFSSNKEPYGDTNTFIIYESGEYTVTVTDSFGCTVSATRYFEYIDVCITNYFTPNGDNVMDKWGPGCTTNYKDLTFDIFDRYGRKVATLGAGQKWDGTYKGAQLPTGDYWYVVKLNDKKDDREFVGNFTLYR